MEFEKNLNFEQHTQVSSISNLSYKIKTEMEKVIVGQNKMVQLLLIGLLSDGHILLEGVPGVAKTLSAKLLARIINLDFSRIQFTPDLMPSDVIGTSVFNPQKGEFNFKKGPVFGNIVLIDEINRAPAKTQAALFEVMEERQISFDANTYKLDTPFIVVATQNPIEQEGTYKLPEAQLDRFLFKITIDYPNLNDEITILKNHHNQNSIETMLNNVQKVIEKNELLEQREIVNKIVIDDKLLLYIASIVNQTRNNNSLYLGASPRASINILKSSKAFAALQGRDFVIPEDIKFVTPYVLAHRIILMPEKEMEGITEQLLIEEILQSVEVPR